MTGDSDAAARRLRAVCWVSAALLIAILVWLAMTLYPSTEAVRLRNAFLVGAEAFPAEAFAWDPEHAPASFRLETRSAPANIRRGVETALQGAPASDWARALRLTEHLVRGARRGGAIQAELGTNYDRIVNEGRGYCADFTEVFLAMAHEAGIASRQWAFAFDGFGGHGHVLVEIFDRADGRWKMIDVFNNIYGVDVGTERVLSALEFREFIIGARQGVAIHKAVEGRLGIPVEARLLEYYRRGADQWYMWWANDVVTYNDNPTLARARVLGNTVEKLVATVIGAHPSIRILRTRTNAQEITNLATFRARVVAGMVAALLTAAVLAASALLWRRARRRSRSEDTDLAP